MLVSAVVVYAAIVWLLNPRLAREALESARNAVPLAGGADPLGDRAALGRR